MGEIILKSRGREIREKDLAAIKEIVAEYFSAGRRRISRELSKYWGWYQPNGELKDMACREILLRLERAGHIKLPPPRLTQNGNNHKRKKENKCLISLPGIEEEYLEGQLKDFLPIKLELIKSGKGHQLWNSLVARYHYQGYRRIVGASLKYICYALNKPIACLGWGSAAWNVECRDRYIGWDKETKDKNLAYIVNNIRFLILPHVRIKYLASHLLALSVRQLPFDWQSKYGHPIYLLETFVEKDRFKGTSYRAANWIHIGETRGFSKRGSSHYCHGNIKDVYVYPLCWDFREKLKGRSG